MSEMTAPGIEFMYMALPTIYLIVGSMLLYIAFMVNGVIAKRYQKMHNIDTKWEFMMLAPSGLLVYTILQFRAYMPGELSQTAEWVCCALILLSGVLCVVGELNFRKVIAGVDR